MNGLIVRPSAAVATAMDSPILASLGVRCVTRISALMLGVFPALADAQSPCAGIHVKILDMRNSTGAVACALFQSSEGFPVEYLRSATHIVFVKIRDKQARCDFQDIPPGTYALAVVHDENMNGKLDANWMGVPREGYGFSNDAKGLLGAPTFSAASFPFGGQNLELTISLNY